MSATAAAAVRPRMSPLADTDSPILLPMWSDVAGWGFPQYSQTMQCATLLGDLRSQQLIIRGPSGLLAQSFHRDWGYWVPLPDGPPSLSDANGWDQEEYYSTIQFADINGDGCAELIARGAGGIVAWTYNQNTQIWTGLPFGPQWSDQAGGKAPWTYQTICSGDINHDGRDELLSLVVNGTGLLSISTWNYNPTTESWNQIPEVPATLGLQILPLPQYYTTLACADVNGDGIAEVLIRLSSGLAVLFFDGETQTWSRGADLEAMSDANGWAAIDCCGTIRYGRLAGNQGVEVVGRSPSGVVLAFTYSQGTSNWAALAYAGKPPGHPPVLSWPTDWIQPQYYKTIQLADINNDGRAELLARDSLGLVSWCYTSEGVWSNPQQETTFSDAQGWNQAPYYSSIRCADIDGDGAAEVVARGVGGVYTLRWTSQGWVNATGGRAAFPAYTGEEQQAYVSISTQVTQDSSNQTNDVRSLYGTASVDFDALIGDMGSIVKRPGSIPRAAWDPVFDEIQLELNQVSAMDRWFDLTRSCIEDTFNSDTLTVASIQGLVEMSTNNNDNTGVVFEIMSVVCDIAWAVLGVFPGITEGAAAANLTLLSGTAGLLSGAFSAATISGGGQSDGISTTVAELQYNLSNWYSNLKSATDGLQASAAVDWGLIQALTHGPAWPVGLADQITASATQGYRLALFQLIMPLHWYVAFWKSNNVPLPGYPSQYTVWDGTYQYWLQDSYTTINNVNFPSSQLFQILFTTGTGNLGASVSDLLLGNNGWALSSVHVR